MLWLQKKSSILSFLRFRQRTASRGPPSRDRILPPRGFRYRPSPSFLPHIWPACITVWPPCNIPLPIYFSAQGVQWFSRVFKGGSFWFNTTGCSVESYSTHTHTQPPCKGKFVKYSIFPALSYQFISFLNSSFGSWPFFGLFPPPTITILFLTFINLPQIVKNVWCTPSLVHFESLMITLPRRSFARPWSSLLADSRLHRRDRTGGACRPDPRGVCGGVADSRSGRVRISETWGQEFHCIEMNFVCNFAFPPRIGGIVVKNTWSHIFKTHTTVFVTLCREWCFSCNFVTFESSRQFSWLFPVWHRKKWWRSPRSILFFPASRWHRLLLIFTISPHVNPIAFV